MGLPNFPLPGFIGDVLATLSNPYGAPSQAQWNLTRGVYKNKKTSEEIVFFFEQRDKDEDPTAQTGMDQVNDTGGRRIAVYEYPYRDGQKLKDLGRKGELYTFNIKFYGANYQTMLDKFIKIACRSSDPGTIIHPVRGAISVRFRDYEFLHRHDEWNSVTIKAIFMEDNTVDIATFNATPVSKDSSIRSALQTLMNIKKSISQSISDISAVLLLPAAIQNASRITLQSITDQISGLIGQLAATFSTDQNIKQLAAQAASTNAGSVTSLSSGTVNDGGQTVNLPPVLQIGFDPETQTAIDTQTSNFVGANQITPQQAIFQANQARAQITTAIATTNETMGNLGYNIVLQYRALAVSLQEAVEASISQSNSKVKIYTVPVPMSLRTVAKNNGLDYNRQNDIESLNPYLPSVNFLPAGTVITVPAS